MSGDNVRIHLYHMTDDARLPSIVEEGLDPERSREPAYRKRAVYLSADYGHALAYASHHRAGPARRSCFVCRPQNWMGPC